MAREHDDAAFPRPASDHYHGGKTEHIGPQEGLTVREWYAGMALQGIAAGLAYRCVIADVERDYVAKAAFEFADAMLAESKKGA